VQRLDLDCLEAYRDGTPRLRIPVGECKSERLVPLHGEAAAAILELQGLAGELRGFRDKQTGIQSRRLFVLMGARDKWQQLKAKAKALFRKPALIGTPPSQRTLWHDPVAHARDFAERCFEPLDQYTTIRMEEFRSLPGRGRSCGRWNAAGQGVSHVAAFSGESIARFPP